MAQLIDFIALALSVTVTYAIYRIYYYFFVVGYFTRLKKAIDNGETLKAEWMKHNALKKQPKRAARFLSGL